MRTRVSLFGVPTGWGAVKGTALHAAVAFFIVR